MKFVALTSILLCLSACNSTVDAQPTTLTASNKMESAMPDKQLASAKIEFQGTVKYITLEGGFYAIYADDGRKFMPRKLGEIYRRHGLVVKVTGKVLKDVMTVQQHGQVLDISTIEIIDDSNIGRLEDM